MTAERPSASKGRPLAPCPAGARPRWLAHALVALLLATAGLSAAPAQARHRADPPVTITFWHAMRGGKERLLRDLVAQFQKQNPEIHVAPHFVGSSNKQWGNDYNALYRGILESLATHTPPDVAMVYENWTTQLIDYSYIVPVQDYFTSSAPFTAADRADLVPVFRQANTYRGKLWTLPFNKSIYVLYYNRAMFRAAHLKVPATWQELRAEARQLTRPDRSVYGMAVQPNVDALGHLLYAEDGDFVSGNQAVFNNSLGVAALKYWVDMVNSDRTALPTFDPETPFTAGKAAMYIYTTSAFSYLKRHQELDLGVAPLPRATGLAPHVQFAGTNLALFKTNPERQLAAWKFIRFMSSRGVSTRWALKTGYLPVRLSAIRSAEYQRFLKTNPQYRLSAVNSLRYAKVQPKVSAWESIRGIIDDAMFEAISRRSTPQEALDRAVALSNDLIRKILGGTAP